MRIDAATRVARHLDAPRVVRLVDIAWLETDGCQPCTRFDAHRAQVMDNGLTTDRVADEGPDVVVVRCDDPRVGMAHARTTAVDSATVVVTTSTDAEALVAAVDAGAIGCLVDDHYDGHTLELAILRGLQHRPSWSGPTVAAVIESLLPTRGRPPVTRCAVLSDRQREIMELVSRGLGNREVAARLFLSEKTIRNHMHNIYRAMGVDGRAAAMACWNRSLRTVDLGMTA